MRRRHLPDHANRQSKGGYKVEGVGRERQDGNDEKGSQILCRKSVHLSSICIKRMKFL